VTLSGRIGIVLVCLLALRCSQPPLAGGTTDTGNARVSATVYRPDGTPASGASVVLRPAQYVNSLGGQLPKSTIDKNELLTNEVGDFTIDSIDTGDFFIEVNDRAALAVLFRFSHTKETPETLSLRDTLRPYATVNGIVGTQNTAIGTWYVRVRGLERLSQVGSDGHFSMSDLPAGTYDFNVSSTEPQTKPVVFDSVNALSGASVTLPLSGWAFSKRLFLNTTTTGAAVTETVARFPVLIRLTKSNFDFGQAAGDGRDVRFAKQDNAPLPYEIERWDSAGGQAELWVKADTVYGANSTHFITMSWGNASAGPMTDGSGVFDTANGFAGVWHMGPASGTIARDATKHHFDGTLSDTAPVPAPGAIGMAYDFDGVSNAILLKNTASSALNFPQNGFYSISAWIFADTLDFTSTDSTYTTDMTVVSKDNCQYALKTRSADWEFFEYASHSGWQGTITPAAKRSWQFVVAVRQGTKQYLYVDGKCMVDSVTWLQPRGDARTTVCDVAIGKMPGKWFPTNAFDGPGHYFNGKIDEVRISNVSLSPGWIKLCYMNQQPQDELLKW
jgi:hypothetical protein